jgi:hypothetical protein
VDLSANRLQIIPNGTLHIRDFHFVDEGIYECVASNLAGRTSLQLYIPAVGGGNSSKISIGHTGLGETSPLSYLVGHVRSALPWFLTGSLALW